MKVILLAVLLFPLLLSAQKTDKKLQAKLQESIVGFNGDIGVFVVTVKSIHTDPEPKDYAAEKVQMEQVTGGRSDYEILNALKDISDIEDHKSRID